MSNSVFDVLSSMAGQAGAEPIEAFDERWRKLTISNDFVFCKAMMDPDLCRDVLEVVLGVDIDHIEYIGRQQPIDSAPNNKSVRLDVYVRDGAGTVFDVEMQSVNTHELQKRSRYYQTLLTVDQIGRGEQYDKLKDTYVVFICCFDLFGRDQRVYSFENMCREVDGLTLGDGAHTVFLSATASKTGQGDGRIDELLDYIASGEVTGELSTRLADAVTRVLDNDRWRLEYMMLEVRDKLNYDQGVLQGRAEGLAQGHANGMAEGLAQGHADGMAEGLAQGRADGMAEGLDRFSRLVSAVVADNRTEDLAQLGSDPDLRTRLFEQYGI